MAREDRQTADADGWRPPALGRAATVQTHCHQHAVMKDDADRELMRRAGIGLTLRCTRAEPYRTA